MNSNGAPVSTGEELDVMITAVGGKGDGIARHKGFVLFVAGTKAGEFVHIRVTKVLEKVGFAEKVGEGRGKPPTEGRRRNLEPVSVKPAEPEPVYEDSEDFGEEEEEESA